MSAHLHAAQNGSFSYTGTLQINVTSSVGFVPVPDASITISDSSTPEQTIEQLLSDESGQTAPVTLPAPNPEYSQEPNQPRPYTDYTIEVEAPGFEPVRVTGSELLPDELSIQPITMNPLEVSDDQAGGHQHPRPHPLWGISAQNPGSRNKDRPGNRRDRFKPRRHSGVHRRP